MRLEFSAKLKSFERGKGTAHVTPYHPWPTDLVTRIVKARVVENARRSAR